MQKWIDKFREILKQLQASTTAKPQSKKPGVAPSYEVNLVPDVKMQMIKAQKMRNLVLFICIVVSVASIGVVLVLFSIKSGQDIAMSTQDAKMEKMSEKLNGYQELGDLVTIQRQLEMISRLQADRPVLSRVFGAVAVVLPQGNDLVKISELRANFDEGNLIRIEGMADARVAPLIDYRVLEALKKGVALMKYDYGRFVDAKGNEIPSWCINEADGNGVPYRDGENYYAWWNLNLEGCKGDPEGAVYADGDYADLVYNKDSEVQDVEKELTQEEIEDQGIIIEESEDGEITVFDDTIEVRKDGDATKFFQKTVSRVKIWRTPQFSEWHKSGYMELNGDISGVQHFLSECTSYSGTMQGGDGSTAKWTSNNTCMLAPEGLTVVSSANGRDESDNLVLRFSATVKFEEEFFAFKNKHMIAIGPMGQNVTDSYVQIGGMFGKEAAECEPGDTECLSNTDNSADDGEEE